MKDNKGDIEKLFQESFDSFEADVDPSVWNNIADKIGGTTAPSDPSSVGSAGSSAGVSAGISIIKVALIASTAGLLTFAGYYMLSSEESNDEKMEVISKEPETKSNAGVMQQHEKVEVMSVPEESIVEEVVVVDSDEKQPAPVDDKKENEQSRSSASKTITAPKETVAINVDDEHNDAKPSTKTAIPETKVVKSSDKDNKKPNDENASEALSPEEIISQKEIFEASIYASVKQGKQPLEVNFENRGSYADRITWIFRDGGASTGPTANHVFDKKGSHWVVLEIRNSKGQISRDSMEITVEGKAYVNVVNTFTPNGDGINDAFMIETDYVKELKCSIFDRNSNIICEWNSIYGHWNGKDRNENDVRPGPYFYVIEAVDMDGQALEPKKGVVTLFR